MKILNKYNHYELGEIYCVGDELDSPICWAKKANIKAFSNEVEEVDVYLNFYCFDINFERNGSELVKKYTENVEKGVIESFNKMFDGIRELENEFVRFYNSCEFKDEFYPHFKEEQYKGELPIVNCIEDIYPYVEEKKLCVYHDGFGVALKLKFMWMSIMVEKTNIFDEDDSYVLTQSIETATKVSMDYKGKLKQ